MLTLDANLNVVPSLAKSYSWSDDGKTLTMDQVIREALRVLRRRRPILHAPAGLMKLLTRPLTLLPSPPLTPDAIVNTVGWALSTWYDRPKHVEAMRRRGMAQDFSWDAAAAEYEALYRRAYRVRRGRDFPG